MIGRVAPGKLRVALLQLALVVLWTLAFFVTERGADGVLASRTLRTRVYPTLRRMAGTYTDLKFRARGPRPPQQKIVIVEVDDRAVSELGRWPWHRDAVAAILQQAFDDGAKVVGLDMAFPEDDVRVPPGVAELLQTHELGDQIPSFETDLMLQRVIDLHHDHLVLGWFSDTACRPRYGDDRPCVVGGTEGVPLPESFEKFAYQGFTAPKTFDPASTPIPSAPDVIANLPGYNAAAGHSGYLVNPAEDPDFVVRRAQVAMFVGGRPHPSMPLEMARAGLEDDLHLTLDAEGLVERAELVKTHRVLPVSKTGAMQINFRGPGYHFPFVGAIDLIGESDVLPVQHDGQIERRPRKEIFQDAYVLVGVTATGARDLRQFPFGSNIPGTEGLATILDNVLSGDPLVHEDGIFGPHLVVGLMTFGALLFCFAMLALDALPAMLLALAVMGGLAAADFSYVFAKRGVDLDAVFLLAELGSIFVATVAAKYVIEERRQKLVRGAFSKYLAPEVVDLMLKDAGGVKLGGESRTLTIMMSDLRGFTAAAGRLKPEQVVSMLNNYLGTMADIVIEHRGTIDEFIGDAILVIFGAPIARPDDARRAVACAVAMQRAMKGINEHNVAAGLPKIEMGIALNTGEVIVGNIGSEKHVKYGVVGSHVNLTARIESNTVGGQVLISGSTLERAGEDLRVGEKQMIVAKGFPEPIAAYEVLGIGGEYNLFLDEVDLALAPLGEAVTVRYRVMKGKNEEGPEQSGRFVALSTVGAELAAEAPLEAFENVKMRIAGPDGALLDGDVYAKVVEAGATCRLRFTSVPPSVEAFVKERVDREAPERSTELAERG